MLFYYKTEVDVFKRISGKHYITQLRFFPNFTRTYMKSANLTTKLVTKKIHNMPNTFQKILNYKKLKN